MIHFLICSDWRIIYSQWNRSGKSRKLLEFSLVTWTGHLVTVSLSSYCLLPLTVRHSPFFSSSCYNLIIITTITHSDWVFILCKILYHVFYIHCSLHLHATLLLSLPFYSKGTGGFPMVASSEIETGDLTQLSDSSVPNSSLEERMKCCLPVQWNIILAFFNKTYVDLPHSMRKLKHSTEGELVEK